jgi:hypothetical protein
MTRANKNLILDRGTRDHGARAAAGSRLHDHYAAVLAEPLPADIKDLVAQLVALDAREEKANKRSLELLQLAASMPGQWM